MSFMSVFDNNQQPEEGGAIALPSPITTIKRKDITEEDKIRFVDRLGNMYVKNKEHMDLGVRDIFDVFEKEIGKFLPPEGDDKTHDKWRRMRLFLTHNKFTHFSTGTFLFTTNKYGTPYRVSSLKKYKERIVVPKVLPTTKNKSINLWKLSKGKIIEDLGNFYLENRETIHLSISDLMEVFTYYADRTEKEDNAELRLNVASFVNSKSLDGEVSDNFVFLNSKDINTNRPYIISRRTKKISSDIEQSIKNILPLLKKNNPYKVREIVELLDQKDKLSLNILTNNKFFKEQELEKLLLQYDRKTISNIKIIQELVPNNSHETISYWSFMEEEVIIQPQIEIVPYIEPSYMEIEEAKKRILNTLVSRVLDEKSEMCDEEILLLMDEDKDLSMLLEYYKFKEDEDYETIEGIIDGILTNNSDKNIGDWKIVRTIKILDGNNKIPLWSKKEVERYIEEDPEIVIARVIKRLWGDTGYSTLALLSIVKKTEFTFYENVLNKKPWVDHERLLAILNHVSKKNLNGKVIWQKRSYLEGWYIEDYVEESVVINKKTEIEERLERIESKLDAMLKYTLEKITRPVPVNIDIPIHEVTEEDIFDTIEIGKSFTIKELMYIHKTDDHVIRSRLKKLVKKGLIKYDKEKFSFTNQENQTQATWRDRYSRATQEEVND